jgi:hypothetical protein
MSKYFEAGQELWNSALSGSNRENLIVATIRGRSGVARASSSVG